VQTVVLWSTQDLGYLTVYASWLLTQNKIPQGATSLKAGRLGSLEVRGSEIVLGPPLIINKSNIDQFNF
jgi:rhamnose transport system permease protein